MPHIFSTAAAGLRLCQAPGPSRVSRKDARVAAAAVLVAVGLAAAALPAAASSFQESNGVVVVEAEDFDVNFTTSAGAWALRVKPLASDPFSGWGYLAGTGVGGASSNFSPHVDFKVNFTNTGPHYIWVSASDAGGKTVDIALDGWVSATSADVGGTDGVFGPRNAGQIWWVGYNNIGAGYFERPYLDVPTAGEHVVSLYVRDPGLYVDRLLLTTDLDFVPSPENGGANSGANVPGETLAPVPVLGAAVTQPAPGRSFSSNSVVIVAAKPFVNAASVSKISFYAGLLPSGSDVKIGEAVAQPFTIGWTNPAVGNYVLKAVVTDSASLSATSAPVNVAVTMPQTSPTPLVWATNNFDATLGRFSLAHSNHVTQAAYPGYPIDFDWAGTSNAGGSPGELGGTLARLPGVTPYVAEPLSQSVSLNDELWFTTRAWFANGTVWNTDFFFGYFDTNSPDSRVGFKILNPNPGWRFRLFAVTQSANLPVQLPDQQAGQLEFHWIPSGLGDGSGKAIGTVGGVSFTNTWPANGATFNAFGWLLPRQPDFGAQTASAWFDSVEYKVPGFTAIVPQRTGKQLVLRWEADGYTVQYNDVSPASANTWIISPAPIVHTGRVYYSTNTIGDTARYFRLKLNSF